MATGEDQQADSLKQELRKLLKEMRLDEEKDARDQAIQIAQILEEVFGIEASVHKASTYRELNHRRELAISIPEASFDKLLRLIQEFVS